MRTPALAARPAGQALSLPAFPRPAPAPSNPRSLPDTRQGPRHAQPQPQAAARPNQEREPSGGGLSGLRGRYLCRRRRGGAPGPRLGAPAAAAAAAAAGPCPPPPAPQSLLSSTTAAAGAPSPGCARRRRAGLHQHQAAGGAAQVRAARRGRRESWAVERTGARRRAAPPTGVLLPPRFSAALWWRSSSSWARTLSWVRGGGAWQEGRRRRAPLHAVPAGGAPADALRPPAPTCTHLRHLGAGNLDLLKVSLPVKMFEPRSYLQKLTDPWVRRSYVRVPPPIPAACSASFPLPAAASPPTAAAAPQHRVVVFTRPSRALP